MVDALSFSVALSFKHVNYEQTHQYDIHFAVVELFMTYKMSTEISMQNVVGG